MYYRVRGRLREETAAEFRRLLRDGTIARQRPDGQEIVESMERAVITKGGVVEWSQVCYCPTPLQHERATVYDRFFDEMATERAEEYLSHDGRRFLAHLDELADASSAAFRPVGPGPRLTVAAGRRGHGPPPSTRPGRVQTWSPRAAPGRGQPSPLRPASTQVASRNQAQAVFRGLGAPDTRHGGSRQRP